MSVAKVGQGRFLGSMPLLVSSGEHIRHPSA